MKAFLPMELHFTLIESTTTPGTVGHFLPQILHTADYSPLRQAQGGAFGVQLPERTFEGEGYRYGFQGQEKDDELKGPGNSVNYKYRMHDPRLGRFFAVDPLFREYPWNSNYAFQENKLGMGIELEGLELAPWAYIRRTWAGEAAFQIATAGNIIVENSTQGINLVAEAVTETEGNLNKLMKSNPFGLVPDFELKGVEGAKKVAQFESDLGTGLSATPLAPVGAVLKGKSALMETFIDMEDDSKSTTEKLINTGIRASVFVGGQKLSDAVKGQVKKGLFDEGKKQSADRAIDLTVNIVGDKLEEILVSDQPDDDR